MFLNVCIHLYIDICIHTYMRTSMIEGIDFWSGLLDQPSASRASGTWSANSYCPGGGRSRRPTSKPTPGQELNMLLMIETCMILYTKTYKNHSIHRTYGSIVYIGLYWVMQGFIHQQYRLAVFCLAGRTSTFWVSYYLRIRKLRS